MRKRKEKSKPDFPMAPVGDTFRWPPEIIKKLVPGSKGYISNKYEADYEFNISGFLQSLTGHDIRRRLYGSFALSEWDTTLPIVPVTVDYNVLPNDELIETYYTLFNEELGKTHSSRKYMGTLTFNGRGGIDRPYTCIMDFQLFVLEEEWRFVKDCLYFLGIRKSGPIRMCLRVVFPEKPNPDTITEQSMNNRLFVSRIWLLGALAFDLGSLIEHPAFPMDYDEMSII